MLRQLQVNMEPAMRKALLLLAAATALAACQRPATSRQNPVVAITPAAASADAALGTPHAPGLWEQRVSDGTTVQVLRACLDAAVDRQAALAGRALNENNCSSHSVTRGPDSWRIATVCDMGLSGRVSTTGVATGDFARRYQIRFESDTTGASVEQLNGHRRLVVDAALQGPCPAGMAPGDVEQDGRRVQLASLLPPAVTPVPSLPGSASPAPAGPQPAPVASPSGAAAATQAEPVQPRPALRR
jgi:hypothetical protein